MGFYSKKILSGAVADEKRGIGKGRHASEKGKGNGRYT